MIYTKENLIIPPCCQSCIAEGNIDKARLAMAYEDGKNEARREFKEYLKKKYKEASNSYDKTEAKRYEDRMDYIKEILINELFGE